MANPVIINPTLTLAGQAAAFNASNDGIELKMTHVSFGRAHYDPTGDERALKSPVGSKVTLAGGSRPTPHQIRMVSSWREDVGEVPVGEIGFWAGDVLVFVWSKADGTIASYKTDGVSYVLFNDLSFAQVPAGSINFAVDPDESVALAALAAHEGAHNAHPQYLLRADVAKDSGPLAWLGLAAGTANALDLSLVAKEAVLPDYAPGQRFQFRAKVTNTGAVTAKIAGLGVKSVKKAGDAGLIDVEAGDIKADALYDLNYDGTSFQLGGGVGSGKAFVRYSFTASVAQSVFAAEHTIGATVVLRDGREVTDFQSDGAKITLRTPCEVNTSVEILAFKSFKVADTYTKAELQALLATASGVPVGAMLPFPRGVLPLGFLEVDGSQFDPLMYPDLAAYLGSSTLPESRGEFLRGWDHSRGKDPGRAPGTLQAGQLERHAHKDIGFIDNVENNIGAVGVTDAHPVSSIFGKVYGTAATKGKGYQEDAPGSMSGSIGGLFSGSTGGNETRPSNLAVMWCIKAWNAPVNQGTIDVGVLVSSVQGFMRDEATLEEVTSAPDATSKHWVSVRRLLGALKAIATQPLDDRGKNAANTEFVRSQIESANQALPVHAFRKNLLINGNFDVWQRGDVGQVSAANSAYSADRWMVFTPAGVTAKWEKAPFTTGNGFNGARAALSVTYTGSAAGANLRQRIESVETAAGKAVTVSFYMQSSVAQNCTVVLRQAFGAGGSPDVEYYSDFSVTSSYKKFTATFNLASVAGKVRGSNDCLELCFVSKANSTHTVILSSAQLEVGAVATEFEYYYPGTQLSLCKRYYEKSFILDTAAASNYGPGTCLATFTQVSAANVQQSAMRIDFSVTKRVIPSMRLYSPGDSSSQVWAQSIGAACTQTFMQSLWRDGFSLSCVPPSGSLPGHTMQIEWTADSEL